MTFKRMTYFKGNVIVRREMHSQLHFFHIFCCYFTCQTITEKKRQCFTRFSLETPAFQCEICHFPIIFPHFPQTFKSLNFFQPI